MKRTRICPIGGRFGAVVVIADIPIEQRADRRRPVALAKCDCGSVFVFRYDQMTHDSRVRSCGCLRKQGTRTTHGMTGSPEHQTWKRMNTRCNDKSNIKYPQYGGRGITVCDRWREFSNFFADMGPKPSGYSLDRIDNDKGYSKENCRWATPVQQCRNRGITRLVSAFGETRNMAEAAETNGIKYATLKSRLRAGWRPEDALTRPIKRASP